MAKWDLSKLEKPQFGAAQARRFYMHVQEGGTLTARDVGRMVEALEEVFQIYVDANGARIDAEAKLAQQDDLVQAAVAAALREAADVVEDYCSDAPDLAGHGHSGAIRDSILALIPDNYV